MKPIICLAVTLTLLPVPPVSSVTPQEASKAPAATAARTKGGGTAVNAAASTSDTHLLRCWQFGRLLFEEVVRTLPEEGSRYRMESHSTGRPVVVFETRNATCLLRAIETPPQ